MSYRNITVDEIKYKYVTGKTHTKVVGIGVVKNEDIGTYLWKPLTPCGKDCRCSCDPYEETLTFSVTPKDVSLYIQRKLRGNVNFPFNKCPENWSIGIVRNIEFFDHKAS